VTDRRGEGTSQEARGEGTSYAERHPGCRGRRGRHRPSPGVLLVGPLDHRHLTAGLGDDRGLYGAYPSDKPDEKQDADVSTDCSDFVRSAALTHQEVSGKARCCCNLSVTLRGRDRAVWRNRSSRKVGWVYEDPI